MDFIVNKTKNNELVLVVDDCQLTLKAISELLKEHGFGVLTSSNAGIAMSMLLREKIDLVISDIKMPDIDGIQLLDKIHNFKPAVPVILMTGYADLNMAVSAINSGAFDFILKPFDAAYFINLISRAFDYIRLKKTERLYKEELEDRVNQRTNEMMLALKKTEKALAEVKTLSGIFPICSCCKKIRDDKGYWEQVEVYIQNHSDVEFSHGYCPECAQRLYPKYFNNNK